MELQRRRDTMDGTGHRVTVALLAGALAAATLAACASGDAGEEAGAPAPSPATTAAPDLTAPTAAPSPAPTEAVAVVWARGGLESATADRIAALPAVTATAFIRSATLGLVGSRDADGTVVDRFEDGYRVAVAVAAVEPAELAAIATGAGAEAIAGLRPGEVLLSETAARLRRLGAGATIDLVTMPGLVVAGVVPDGTVRRAELVLHVADADAAGIDADGSVLLRWRSPAGEEAGAAARVEDAIHGVLPPDAPGRVVHAEETYTAPLVLPLLEVKERFGELAYRPRPGVREVDAHPDFVAEHIVDAAVPILGTVRCHRGIVDDLRAALDDVVAEGLAGSIDPSRYAGCFYPRLIATDRDGLSRHSWGIAVDINVDLSRPGLGDPPPPGVIAAFERHGFRWGGDFLQPDNHHFEWIGQSPSVGSPPS